MAPRGGTSWDPLVRFTDWLFADTRRSRVAMWVIFPILAGIIVAMPWIDEALHPPFGRYWPWNGTTGGSSDAGEKLVLGLGYLLFMVVIGGLLELRRRQREERPTSPRKTPAQGRRRFGPRA